MSYSHTAKSSIAREIVEEAAGGRAGSWIAVTDHADIGGEGGAGIWRLGGRGERGGGFRAPAEVARSKRTSCVFCISIKSLRGVIIYDEKIVDVVYTGTVREISLLRDMLVSCLFI